MHGFFHLPLGVYVLVNICMSHTTLIRLLIGTSNQSHIYTTTQFYKIQSEIWVALPPPQKKILRPQNITFRHDFAQLCTTLQLDREYLRNLTSHRQSENGVANYGHSRTGKLNVVHKQQKIGPTDRP